MPEKEWFRGEEWDTNTQILFEDKLKRSRGSYNKAQYIRIKASYLLNSRDQYKKSEGCKLMERVIKEYPAELSHVKFAYELLGDFFFNEKKYEDAEFNFRQSISFYRENGRSGTSGIGDIKLAETVIKTEQYNKYIEMYHLLVVDFKKNDGSLTLNDEIFRFYSVLAKISDKLKMSEEAKNYAQKALEIAIIEEPQLDSYPKIGIVKVDNDELTTLSNILKNN